ncbi:hypothetical protein NBRC111893_1170 [Lentilactobacillus kosonis]|uniref:Uncharacterized protein n=1 Tax=Lentilactobacillus kosonis TaxID=2810561 RepID=A0A401FKW2_9LACO|nr:hypothetical protein NBRC111893_1170 [Lentilactobacillus kosonis]
MRDDYLRASDRIILDARAGKLGGFTLDTLADLEAKDDAND